MHIAQTRVSPSILSAGSLLLACGWFVAAVIFVIHRAGTANDTVPDFWVAVFFVSGPFAVLLAWAVFQFRRREYSSFQKIDRIAIVLAGIILIGYVSFVASLYFRTQRLRREQAFHALQPTPVGVGSSGWLPKPATSQWPNKRRSLRASWSRFTHFGPACLISRR